MGNLDDAFATSLIGSAVTDGDLLRLLDETGTVLAGGSYADQPVTWADSGFGKGNASDVVFPAGLPAATVVYYEIWDSTATTRKWHGLIGEIFAQVALVSDSTITTNSSDVADDQMVVFTATAAGDLTAGTVYYVVNSVSGKFQVAATVGGSPVVLTDNYSLSYGFPVAVASGDSLTFAASYVYAGLA